MSRALPTDTLEVMGAPMMVWDDAMLGYDFGAAHPFHPDRWRFTLDLAGRLGVLERFDRRAPAPATDDELALIHTRDYLAAVRAAPHAPPGAALRYGLGTDDNPVFDGMHEAAALIAGGSVTAARALARGEALRAVNIGGGLHHAMPSHAAGFCVYNDAALAIATLLAEGVRRIAYVDIDVHHGDGVQHAFYDDPRVLTVSIHESPHSLWPGTGFAAESGSGAAAGTAVNLPVPAGTDDAGWLRAFHAVVPSVLRAFAPEVLVTQHGADAHRDDPLADLELTVDGQRAAALALAGLAEELTDGRWLALGGGGYALATAVPRAWTHLLAVVADDPLETGVAVPERWRARVAAAWPGVEIPTTMSDTGGRAPAYLPWGGDRTEGVDRAIAATRTEVFPLHGLDPDDPRD